MKSFLPTFSFEVINNTTVIISKPKGHYIVSLISFIIIGAISLPLSIFAYLGKDHFNTFLGGLFFLFSLKMIISDSIVILLGNKIVFDSQSSKVFQNNKLLSLYADIDNILLHENYDTEGSVYKLYIVKPNGRKIEIAWSGFEPAVAELGNKLESSTKISLSKNTGESRFKSSIQKIIR